MSRPVVFVFGSRRLSSAGVALASSLGASLAGAGFGVSVGCAPGADLAFVRGVLSVPGGASVLSVFAAGGPGGAGLPAGLGPGAAVAAAAGASVSWWAGGPRSVPLRVRLAARSAASLAGSSAGFGVAVVGSWSSPGSRGSVRRALAAGQSVFVFPVGFPGGVAAARSAGWPGRWVRSSFFGLPCLLVSPR